MTAATTHRRPPPTAFAQTARGRRGAGLWTRVHRLWSERFGRRRTPQPDSPAAESKPSPVPEPAPSGLPPGLPEELWPGPGTLPRLAEASAELRSLRARLGHSRRIEQRWGELWDELVPQLAAPKAETLLPLLDRLEALVAAAGRGPAAERAPAVGAAIDRLRCALRRPGGHLTAPQAALVRAIESWQDGLAAAAERHRTLGAVLLPLARARRRIGDGTRLSRPDVTAIRTALRRPIRCYLDARWLHDRWLTSYCLATLLATDLLERIARPARGDEQPASEPAATGTAATDTAATDPAGGARAGSDTAVGDRVSRSETDPAAVGGAGDDAMDELSTLLGRIWQEAAAGELDRRETARRLRRLEDAGVYIDSLALALLRLPADADEAAPAEPMAPPVPGELPPDGWPGGRDPEALLYETPELAGLLRRLGYSPAAERRWPRLHREIEVQIQTEIPDFAAFRTAVERIGRRLDEEPTADAAHRARRDDPLLRAVLAAGDDRAAVLAALDREPVGRLLPFLEEIPVTTRGEIAWRAPVDVPVLRKRPRDPGRFRRLLDELEQLVGPAQTAAQGRARQEVMDALERTEKTLAQEGGYLPAPLRTLFAKVDGWLRDSHAESAAARRRTLETLLADLIEARHHWGVAGRLEAPEAAAFRATAQEHARRYLAAGWAHTPWLTAYAAANLLAAERSALRVAGAGQPPPAAAVLERVWREVVSGSYDAAESARRLRELEAHGVFVHSLAFALLRLRADGPDATEEAPWRS